MSVAVWAPEVTRSVITWDDGPSSIPRASSWAQVKVGVAPVASPNVPSPLTSQV